VHLCTDALKRRNEGRGEWSAVAVPAEDREAALSDGGLYWLSVQLMNKPNIIVVAPLQAELLLSM
jgi:hypothetical protein